MSGMILCRSEYSKRPYHIEGAGVNVYSIEEISYFLYHDIYLVGADFFCEGFFTFIERDIKEPELATRLRFLKEQKAGLSELVLTILRYVDFYSEEEIAQLGSLIERLDTQNVWERLKARADNYLSTGRYNSAIVNYEDIVHGKHDASLGEVFYGNVWHNMGVAYAEMFDYIMAAECFRQAMELNHDDATIKCYYYAKQFIKMAEEKTQEEVSMGNSVGEDEEYIGDENEELMYVAGRELETSFDNAVDNEGYISVAKLLEDKKQGRVSEYYDEVEKLIRLWQDEYRRYTG